MLSGLLIILLPLLIGYVIPFRQPVLLRLINRVLSWIVYIILFLMGISLAFLDNLSQNLLSVLCYAAVSAVVILSFNAAALAFFSRYFPWQHPHQQEQLPSRLAMAVSSLALCGVVVLGFLVGLTQWSALKHATEAGEYTLYLLLFLIGIQLRHSGMSMKDMMLNRQGLFVAVVVVISALLAGCVNAYLLDLPIKTALAMASGFGWYSLSGILMTENYGPVIGSAAFFNDLARELVAILFIPTLISRHRATALGLCGATSMDFTLPILQRTGGLEIVPAAIVHGFVLSLLVPILMAFFAA